MLTEAQRVVVYASPRGQETWRDGLVELQLLTAGSEVCLLIQPMPVVRGKENGCCWLRQEQMIHQRVAADSLSCPGLCPRQQCHASEAADGQRDRGVGGWGTDCSARQGFMCIQ